MLLIIPISLLTISSVIILFLSKRKVKFSTIYLVAIIGSFLSWISILILRFFLPSRSVLINWSLFGFFPSSPELIIDYISWPYAFSFMTLCLAVVFTDSARVKEETSIFMWVGNFLITAINLLSVFSGNPLTFILIWVLVDFIEFIYLFSLKQSYKNENRLVLSLGIRIFAIFTSILAISRGSIDIRNLTFENIPSISILYFFVAAILRIGIFRRNTQNFYQSPSTRGIETLIQLAPIASSLVLISRLPIVSSLAYPELFNTIRIVLTITAFITSFAWLFEKDIVKAQHNWIISLIAFSIVGIINGEPAASRTWGVTLLLSGGTIFLFSPHIKRLRFLLFGGMITLIGLPFTLSASGWFAVIKEGYFLWNLLWILSHALLVLGFCKHALSPSQDSHELEAWGKLLFPFGIIFIIQSSFIMNLIGWPGVFTVGLWIASLCSLIICLLFILSYWLIRKKNISIAFVTKSLRNLTHGQFYNSVKSLLNFKWFFLFIKQIFIFFRKTITSFFYILEGEGGILWAILILLLIVTIIFNFGGN